MQITSKMFALLAAGSLLSGAALAETTEADAPASASSPSVIDKTSAAVSHGAKVVVEGVEHGAKAAVNGVERGARAASNGIERGAQATGRAVSKVAQKIGISQPGKPAETEGSAAKP